MTRHGIVVVGAGIVGASVAYHLSACGVPVTLVDTGPPGSGVTRSSFAWIGRPDSSDQPSAALRNLAVEEYHRLAAEVPELPVRWSGSLCWDGFQETLGRETTESATLEPALLDPPARAFHHPEDGALDAVAACEVLVATARDRGARLVTGTRVTRLVRRGDAVCGVDTTAGAIPADDVVLAAGTGSTALCAGVGLNLPVASSPAVMVRLRADPGLVRMIVATPSMEFRQLDDGTVLSPVAHRGESDPASLERTADRVRDLFATTFAGGGGAVVEAAEVGGRPMPVDGEPIIGRFDDVGGLYVTVMHSAIALAAAVGRLAAAEIATGVLAPELAGCRPGRFR